MRRVSVVTRIVFLCLPLLIFGCGGPAQPKNAISQIYELPTQSQRPDNDSYYQQPAIYKGCAVINDAPSCGGG